MRRSSRPKRPVPHQSDTSDEILDDTYTPDKVQDKRPKREKKASSSRKGNAKKPTNSPSLGDPHNTFDYIEIPINQTVDQHNSDKLTEASASSDKFDRGVKVLAHKAHLICLFVAFLKRSLALETPFLKSYALSLIPIHLIRLFTPEIIQDGRTFFNSISMLANWWKNRNQTLSSTSPSKEYQSKPNDIEAMYFYRIKKTIQSKQGVEPDLVAAFVVILRSLGLKARFVCSLDPIGLKTTEHKSRGDRKNPVPSIPKFWCEIMHPTLGTWVPVDCIRAIVNERLVFDSPKDTFSPNLYIIAYSLSGKALDVTRRYSTRYYSFTLKTRKPGESTLSFLLDLYGDDMDPSEKDELESLVDSEPIPTTKSGFQGNARYMLESQLRKYEVFWPHDVGIVGQFKDQNIRLRSAVKKVRSKDSWYTQYGRVIKSSEAPIKEVKLPKKPEKKLKNSLPDLDNKDPCQDYVTQPLYGEWQTEPFSPPISKDGVVPINKFGNVDLFLPSMLPIGCVWIKDDLAYMAAKDLGVDYAAACVRFAFSGRIAVPNLKGIVICAEHEGEVLKRLNEIKLEAMAIKREKELQDEKEMIKLEKRKKKVMDKLVSSNNDNQAKDKLNIVSRLGEQTEEETNEIDNLFE